VAAKAELLEILTEKEKEWFPEKEEAPATPLRAATKEAPFVNSLGLEFVPVPGKDGVWMARTETRVRDFEKFVEATTYDATEGAFTLESGGWKQAGGSWKDPRFSTSAAQTPDHPVVCVSWEDARAFCAWLGAEEGLRYRLPTDEEWSLAAGQGKYPWGNQFPPPRDGGNYAGGEANTGAFTAKNYAVIANFNDGSARTSRVGQYAENRFGFFDLGGNVFEWCEDPYRASMNDADLLEAYSFLKDEKDSDGTPFRVLRGGSWSDNAEVLLRSSCRRIGHPTVRYVGNGFRLVVSVGVGG
jgi:formylglycine-generating enzyme required for sulfatase activity